MAGVTDRPFRQLCKNLGAGMAVSEMVSSNSLLWGSEKTKRRADHLGETRPCSVQIVGADPNKMRAAAQYNAEQGAEIMDINMGCPAKKVCNTLAGSALLRDENLVGKILEATVQAVEIPVTLKIRTGWDKAHKNGMRIAKIAENAGIKALFVHGRTRACGFKDPAEYDTIAAIKAHVQIPVFANGDITTPEQAKKVLEYTRADGIMIGRAAQGNPWIFREILHYLETGQYLPKPSISEIRDILLSHLYNLYAFYGEKTGVHVARKHVSWYSRGRAGGANFRHAFYQLEAAEAQLEAAASFFVNQENERA